MKVLFICLLIQTWLHKLTYCQESKFYGCYIDEEYLSVLKLDSSNRFLFVLPPGPKTYAKDTIRVVGNWHIFNHEIVLASDSQPSICNELYYLELFKEELSATDMHIHIRTILLRSDDTKVESDRTWDAIAIEVNNNGANSYVDPEEGTLVLPRMDLENIIFRLPYLDCPKYVFRSRFSNYLEIIYDETVEPSREHFIRYTYFADEALKVRDDTLILDNSIFLKKQY